MLHGFLLGVIVTASLTTGLYFLKFWRRTHDVLFLAFAAAFLIEGLNRLCFFFIDDPTEGSPAIYLVRLLTFLMLLAAIIWKNRGTNDA